MDTLADAGVPVPSVLGSDEKEMTLTMSYIDGPKARDVLDKEPAHAASIGTLLARMHHLGIAHGDPTTSNFILSDGTMHVIDFGLSFFTRKTEDFAVDLHLLRQVFSGTHTLVYEKAWQAALDAYVKEWPEGKSVVERLEEKVEKRGRNKKR
jgi:TP53 regulating kinase-like protein